MVLVRVRLDVKLSETFIAGMSGPLTVFTAM